MNKPTVNRSVRATWDSFGSTYFWNIHLDKTHPKNNPNVEKLTGYSKYIDQAEAQDKDYVLKRKIGMLYNQGYFNRMQHAIFYQNTTGIIDKMQCPQILICFPTYYHIPTEQYEFMYKRFGVWLDNFYVSIKEGRDMSKVIPSVRTGKKVDRDYFINPANYDFQSPEQLYEHTKKLQKFGHPPGLIAAFIAKVMRQKGWR